MSPTASDVRVSNIEKALTVSRGIGLGDPRIATKNMDRDGFTQHNLQCAGGVDGFERFIATLNPDPSPIRVVRALEDGQYVVTHAEGDVYGPKVMFDVYRFEDGSIVEHWDNLTEMTGPNRSGHTPVDGPTEPDELDRTEANKVLVRDFFETVFIEGRESALADYFDDDALIQHHAGGHDGVAALRAMLRSRVEAGEMFEEAVIEQVIGQGDFVLVTASGRLGETRAAIYDLFRVENGKIAEHWDVLETVPPRDQWKNSNGKFG